jgi:hypothetical protein
MLGNKMYLLGKVVCALVVLSLAACGGDSPSDNDNPKKSVTPPPTTINPSYKGTTEQAPIDLNSVKPIILDVIYALDTANILIFGSEKKNQLLRPENDFKYITFNDGGECSSGNQNVDFGVFGEKITNGETVDIVGETFKVTYEHCAIGNFVLSGTAELFVKGFNNDNFELTSFNLYIDKTLELTIDGVSYQLQGTVYSNSAKDFTLDILLSTTNDLQSIYLNELAVTDLSTQSDIGERLNYSGNIYFSKLGKVTISSNTDEKFYTFLGGNGHKIIFNFSELNSRQDNNLGYVNLELITNYYSYPNLRFYLRDLKEDLFLVGSNLDDFHEPNIYQFTFPLGTQLNVAIENTIFINDFIKHEWQLIGVPTGVDKSIHYGPTASYQLDHYGDYTLRNITTNSLGEQKTFYKSFNVPKPSNISATIQVNTLNWQLGNTFQAQVISESSPEFTTSLAFGPSGMTVTEEGDITWDGKFFDFGSRSTLNFGVYIETASGKSLVKHTLLAESKLDKTQFKLAQLTYYTGLYPANTNRLRSKFLYEKNNTLSYAHAIGSAGFSQLDVSANNVDLSYTTYDGSSNALTLFDVSYNVSNDAIDYLFLQNTYATTRLEPYQLQIETDLPWVLFNSNNLDNYVEIIGNDTAENRSEIINNVNAQFVELNVNNETDIVYSNTNTPPDNKLKLADKNFVELSELQSSEITKIINQCKLSDNEKILISYDNYVHVKNNDIAIFSLRSNRSGNIGESRIFALDNDNNNFCDTLLFFSNYSTEGQSNTLIEAFDITSSGPIKIDTMETERLYSFQQLKTIFDVSNSTHNIIMFDTSNASHYLSPDEPVNAFTVSLSTDKKIIRNSLVYGAGLDINLSPNKSHIINLVDTNNDGIDEVIINHSLSTNEKLIEQYTQFYTENNTFEVHVIATLNDGILEPTFVSKLFIQNDRTVSINDTGDVVVGNGFQPFVVTPTKNVTTPHNFEQFTGNKTYVNNDGSRYQITNSGLEKYSSNNQKLWTNPSLFNDSNQYSSIKVLGKHQDTILVNYDFKDLYFINDLTGELVLQPNYVQNYSISPDFNETGLLYLDVIPIHGSTGPIQDDGVYRTNDLTGVELVHHWNFPSQYRISRINVSWINIDDDDDFELLFRLDNRDDNNLVLTADYNGNNQKASPYTEYMNPADDLSRSAAWDTKKLGYFSYTSYRSKLTGDIIWKIPFNTFFSDTAYKNGIKQIAVSDFHLYLFTDQ